MGFLTAPGSAPLNLVSFKGQLYIKYTVPQMVVSALEKNRDRNRKVRMRSEVTKGRSDDF